MGHKHQVFSREDRRHNHLAWCLLSSSCSSHTCWVILFQPARGIADFVRYILLFSLIKIIFLLKTHLRSRDLDKEMVENAFQKSRHLQCGFSPCACKRRFFKLFGYRMDR
ncbi:unnamed protein product [Albugo candida]|uniref:Uncharacterized protein n=1 Tax=Albugo candida TaxID=65357 RepID=A0A024G4K5_9STRA|nr:unnamed protein product [Albugo candida]|eukprot:CCI41462.1 unnamed protein product [Albugo candida]